jgi:agmatinase
MEGADRRIVEPGADTSGEHRTLHPDPDIEFAYRRLSGGVMEDQLLAPAFAGIDTFWRAPLVSPDQVPEGYIAILGAPHDMTVSSGRQGARFGPKVIRQQSAHFITLTRCAPTQEVVNLATRKRIKVPDDLRVVDAGDIVLYPNDLDRTRASLRDTIDLVVSRGAFPLVLGGDHYITYPLFEGFGRALTRSGRAKRLGYLHIDGHLDLMDDNKIWGKHWHGSNSRRIAELPFTSVRNMVWLGTNGFTWANEWDFTEEHGLKVLTTSDIRRVGIRDAARDAIATAADGVDAVYVSLDIDVVDIAFAPGTGATNFGGITAVELLDVMEVLSEWDIIKGLDVVEVSPPLDPTGPTARLAATAIMTFLTPRVFQPC